MSDVCIYPKCNCPFDMGPEGLCLRGYPRAADQEKKKSVVTKKLRPCKKCPEQMVAILNPVAGVKPWPVSCWYCAACGCVVDALPSDAPVVREATPQEQEIALGQRQVFCPECSGIDEVYAHVMGPLYKRDCAGLWCVSHWYCAECEWLEDRDNAVFVGFAA